MSKRWRRGQRYPSNKDAMIRTALDGIGKEERRVVLTAWNPALSEYTVGDLMEDTWMLLGHVGQLERQLVAQDTAYMRLKQWVQELRRQHRAGQEIDTTVREEN